MILAYLDNCTETSKIIWVPPSYFRHFTVERFLDVMPEKKTQVILLNKIIVKFQCEQICQLSTAISKF